MPTSCWISMATCSATCPSQVPSAMRLMNPPAAPSEQWCSCRPGRSVWSFSPKPRISLVGLSAKGPRSIRIQTQGR